MTQSSRVGDTVCHLIHRTDYAMQKETSRALEPYGVSVYQAMSLIYVADHEGDGTVNQRALERYTRLSNPGVTKLVTALEKQGLLERSQAPEDARSRALHTTETGRRESEVFRRLILETDLELTHRLTGEESAQLRRLLQKLNG